MIFDISNGFKPPFPWPALYILIKNKIEFIQIVNPPKHFLDPPLYIVVHFVFRFLNVLKGGIQTLLIDHSSVAKGLE